MSTTYTTTKGRYTAASANPIAAGRFTEIFLGVNSRGAEVAIKVFRKYIKNQNSLDSFFGEREALSELKHPHILEIIDWSDLSHPHTYFLVMPFQDGGNFRGLLQGKTFVPIQQLIDSLRQIAAAIDYAHSRGLVHGDIKPENILLNTADGRARLADFGVARHFDTEDRTLISAVPNAGRNAPLGSSAYLSPEQLVSNESSPRSDLYSFALVAYELLAGRLPFDVSAPLYGQLHARVIGNLTPPRVANPAISKSVEAVLLRALSVDAALRPASARAFVRALDPTTAWDIFIAHSSADTRAAEQLYEHLAPHAKTFLDIRCLKPGDNWDLEIARAQNTSLIAVILNSSRTEAAYYEREEIAVSLQKSREQPTLHRVVPVFLDEASFRAPHYGLRLKQGLCCFTEADASSTANQLVGLLSGMEQP